MQDSDLKFRCFRHSSFGITWRLAEKRFSVEVVKRSSLCLSQISQLEIILGWSLLFFFFPDTAITTAKLHLKSKAGVYSGLKQLLARWEQDSDSSFLPWGLTQEQWQPWTDLELLTHIICVKPVPCPPLIGVFSAVCDGALPCASPGVVQGLASPVSSAGV